MKLDRSNRARNAGGRCCLLFYVYKSRRAPRHLASGLRSTTMPTPRLLHLPLTRDAAHCTERSSSTHHIFVQVSPSSLCSAAERQYLQQHEAEESVRGSTRSRSMALPVAALAQAAAVGRAACAHAERRVATELAAARAMRRLKGEKLEIQGFESSARGLQARSHRRCLSAGNEIPLLKSSSNLRANEWGAA